MTKFKKPLLFALCLVPIALVAGVFTGIYQIEMLPEEMVAEAIAEIGSIKLLVVITGIQAAGYAFVCGLFGYIFANKLGLWRTIRVEKKSIVTTLVISLVGGIIFSLDYWIFGSFIEPVKESYVADITASNVIASVLYGGIVEEVMLRLFFMSLIALIVWKLFYKKYDKENMPSSVFVIANIIAALLFAAGHLPATVVLFGGLTPWIIFRCFLLNGGFGLVFGWLYRKHGIAYAMLAHALFHIVSKIIWLIFI